MNFSCAIVFSVTFECITNLVFIRHRKGKWCHWFQCDIIRRNFEHIEETFRCVNPVVSECIFCAQAFQQTVEPHVILETLTDPFGAWMILMSLAIQRFMCFVGVKDPMRGAQELAVFENHLDNVTIDVPFCTLALIKGQRKDVHLESR